MVRTHYQNQSRWRVMKTYYEDLYKGLVLIPYSENSLSKPLLRTYNEDL